MGGDLTGGAVGSALALILTFFVVVALATPSLAADYKTVGVSAGDSIDYSVSYYSTSPDFPESQYVSDGYNRVHVDVRALVETNVTPRYILLSRQ